MDLYNFIALLVPGILLTAGGIGHAVTPRNLSAALRDHAIIPSRLTTPAAIVIVAVELLTGGLSLLAAVRGWSTSLLVLLSAPAIFLIFGIYILILLVRSPGSACGCFGDTRPASMWTALRAFALATLSLSGSLLASHPVPSSAAELFIGIVASGTFAVIFWRFPEALYDPLKEAIELEGPRS